MELGAPSARNSCQISCALEGTSWSGRRLKSCTANQNLQQCHTQSITTSRKCVYSVNFAFFMTSFTLITHALFSLATRKHSSAFYSSSIMLLQHTRLQKNINLYRSQIIEILTAGFLSWILIPGTLGTGLDLLGPLAPPPGRSPISSHAAGWVRDCSHWNTSEKNRIRWDRIEGLVTWPTESHDQQVRTEWTFGNASVSVHVRWDPNRQIPANSG